MSASAFDLAAYLRRIRFDQPVEPTFDVLEALVIHHARVLPFENIDVLAGGVPALDIASLQGKLVQRQRGGYCFEQNSLFMACLTNIGFAVHAREARVLAGVPAGMVTARTHMGLQVSMTEGEFLVDVGFGGLAPLAPLALQSTAEQPAGSGVYRFTGEPSGELLLQSRLDEGWTDCYRLTPGTPHASDIKMGNWFVATHPGTMLRSNLLLGLAQPSGGRLTLLNDKLALRLPQTAAPEERILGSRAEFADVLADGFGLRLDAPDLDAVMATVERQAARPTAG